MMEKLNVVVVGLGFGGAFVPLYLHHPDVKQVGLFDTNHDQIDRLINRYGDIFQVYSSYEAVLNDPAVDCIHLLTPPKLHASMAIAALEKGKHVACAVTMGETLEEIEAVVKTTRESGKNYAMLETAIFTRNFLYAKEMQDTGKLGDVQFLKSEYYQDVEGLQDHWMGYPPMHYSTHSMAPLAYLAKSPITHVYCVGSGTLDPDIVSRYGNPFAVEQAIIEFEKGLKGTIARSFNGVAKEYIEQFDVYGTKATFEWQQINVEEVPVVYTMSNSLRDDKGFYQRRHVQTDKVTPGDYPLDLPTALIPYLNWRAYQEVLRPDVTYWEGGDHHGAHPHLVHDFIRSIIEKRKPICDEKIAANLCAAGILAHQSSLKGGIRLAVPQYEIILTIIFEGIGE